MGTPSGGSGCAPLLSPLPPRPSATDIEVVRVDRVPAAAGRLTPAWSPLRVAVPLSGAVWACFAALVATGTAPAAADAARLAHLLATGAAVVGLVVVTLSVAYAQISGLRPEPVIVGVVVLGAVQGMAAGLARP